MLTHESRCQARNEPIVNDLQTTHPIVPTNCFPTVEAYVLYLLHKKAYEQAAEIAQNKSLLDWGCNDGYGIELLRPFVSEIAGLDSAEVSVKAAHRRLPDMVSMIRLYDGTRLPFPAGSFDVVTSFQVIEHVSDLDTYLAHIVEALKTDGVAIFTTPNKRLRLFPGDRPWNPYHVREFLPSELRQLISQYFSSVELLGLRATPEIESIERKRCEAAKAANHISTPPSKFRSTIVAGLKKFLPGLTSAKLRRLLDWNETRSGRNKVDLLTTNFSTKDMFYSDKDVDNALDLMAVCAK